MPPLVSVLMPVYNGSAFLRPAIESILAQTMCDFEFLIIDDGSTDDTSAIIDSFSDRRIVVSPNPRNLGLTQSLDRGIHMATGKYIARMDADDISLPDRLEKQVEFLERHSDHALVGSAWLQIAEDGTPLREITPPIDHKVIYEQLLYDNCFCHGSVLMRRQIAIDLNGYQLEAPTEDWFLWLRIADQYKVANLAEVLYLLRLNSASISARQQVKQWQAGIQIIQDAFARRRLLIPGYRPHPLVETRLYMNIALMAIANGNTEDAVHYINSAYEISGGIERDSRYILEQLRYRAFAIAMTEIKITSSSEQFESGVNYIHQFFDLLPQGAKNEIGSAKAATLGWLHTAYAFRQRDMGNWSAIRRECLLAWRHDLRNIRNRGLWSIFVKSLVSFPSWYTSPA